MSVRVFVGVGERMGVARVCRCVGVCVFVCVCARMYVHMSEGVLLCVEIDYA